jgi:cyclophilin family peptidyl-prolyl cis-trans isomerase
MVYVSNRYKPRQSRVPWRLVAAIVGTALLLSVLTSLLAGSLLPSPSSSSSSSGADGRLRKERVGYGRPRPLTVVATFDESAFEARAARVRDIQAALVAHGSDGHHNCQYGSLSDLTDKERHPAASTRHMVDPPRGGRLQLVCCDTTAGPLNIAVHHRWAPKGAARFEAMVRSGYFNDGAGAVPFMRCVPGFLCQFGLHSDPAKTRAFRDSIPDDPNWLPEGPDHRQNFDGVKRFAKGYLAYAGGGKDTRDNQFIMALEPNGPLAGGSPWEVPWGELVGIASFQTLSKIHTDYGEDGPPQGKLHNVGMTDEMRQAFPLLDYITRCDVVDEVDDDLPPPQADTAAAVATNGTTSAVLAP